MYIEKIKSPADLKELDLKALQMVADETRQAVLNRVSKHGGHVGPNLGFVEATVTLHYVFNAPKISLCLMSATNAILTRCLRGVLRDSSATWMT